MLRLSGSLASFVIALLLAAPRGAIAGDPPEPPAGTQADKKPAEPAASEPEYKGPEIRWATSFVDAMEEAAQRNVPLYLHSHGST